MTQRPDLTTVVHEGVWRGEDAEDDRLVREMLDEAQQFIEGFGWCRRVCETYIGIAIGAVVGVFLAHIDASEPEVDEWIWVVVGDIPSAYITVEDAPTPAAALDGYVGAMQEWVRAVRAGAPVDELIPVDVPPSEEHADMLATRLEFIDREILPMYEG